MKNFTQFKLYILNKWSEFLCFFTKKSTYLFLFAFALVQSMLHAQLFNVEQKVPGKAATITNVATAFSDPACNGGYYGSSQNLALTKISSKANSEAFFYQAKPVLEIIENEGQWNSNAMYKVKVAGGTTWFTKNGYRFDATQIKELTQELDKKKHSQKNDLSSHLNDTQSKTYNAKGQVWDLQLENISPYASYKPAMAHEGYSNYFIGNDVSKHASKVRRYKELTHQNVYEGIDVRYYGTSKGELEFDFIVAPGADINQIAFTIDGHEGIKINDNGELVLKTKHLGDIAMSVPLSYQIIDGKKQLVDMRYVLEDKHIRFEAPSPVNDCYALVIDPVTLLWSTYFESIVPNNRSEDNFPTTTGAYYETYETGNLNNNVNAVGSRASSDNSTTSFAYNVNGFGLDWTGQSITVGTLFNTAALIARSTPINIRTNDTHGINGSGTSVTIILRGTNNIPTYINNSQILSAKQVNVTFKLTDCSTTIKSFYLYNTANGKRYLLAWSTYTGPQNISSMEIHSIGPSYNTSTPGGVSSLPYTFLPHRFFPSDFVDNPCCYLEVVSPAGITTTLPNICAPATANLTSAEAGVNNQPSNTIITWHTGLPVSNANLVANPTAVGTGIYYAAFHNPGDGCYSNSTRVEVPSHYVACTCPSTSVNGNGTFVTHTGVSGTPSNADGAPNSIFTGNLSSPDNLTLSYFFDASNTATGTVTGEICITVGFSNAAGEVNFNDGTTTHTFVNNVDGTGDATNAPQEFCFLYTGTGTVSVVITESGTGSILVDGSTFNYCPADCIPLELKVFLEGPYSSGTGLMNTTLNDLHMLPGQDEALNTTDAFNLDNTSTLAGQPYNTAPWNYNCPDEMPYGDTSINAGATLYPSTVVDWVLVSIRENNTLAASEIWKEVGLLHADGSIEFPFVYECVELIDTTDYYIVIEHRNHLPIMSVLLNATSGKLVYDFSLQDSWIGTVSSVPFGVGQKNIGGTYVMFAGNTSRSTYQEAADINPNDKVQFSVDFNKIFDFLGGDHNLDGDVNSSDRVIYELNFNNTTLIPF